jgi:ribosomal peptide maturation radical SAM protein 1
MLRVLLVNMPFADWNRPSFALSQLAALTRREFADDVEVDVLYLNQDFAQLVDLRAYEAITSDTEHLVSGVGEWLFTKVAFPEEPDNAEDYFARYYIGSRWNAFRDHLLAIRAQLSVACSELITTYSMASADVVGFTSMFAQTVPSVAMARLIKNVNPDVITIMGGANCEAPMGAAIADNFRALDYIFSGPALRTFPEFLGLLMAGRRDLIGPIRGIVSKENAGDPYSRDSIGPDRDINDYIEPDYDSFRKALSADNMIRAQNGRHVRVLLPFETSRGCWWGEHSHCTFCGLNGLSMGYRAMAPDLALRQFSRLFGFHPWCSDFHCTDNILPKNYLTKVLPYLDPPSGVTIFYEVKLPISEADMKTMARAGVNKVQPGIEALNTGTLKLMGKGTTAFQNIQFLKNCVRYGIEPQWNLLIGFPGEDESVYREYAQNVPHLYHLPPPTGVYIVRYDRYSPYFIRQKDYQLELRPMDFYELVYPLDSGTREQLAYYFVDESLSPHLLTAGAWLKPLRQLTYVWRQKWERNGFGTAPELVLRQQGNSIGLVHDTRDTQRELPIDRATQLLLERLSSPLRVEQLASVSGLAAADVEASVRLLRDHHLVFEEGDRLISLVALPDAGSLR